jgi:hypothetical protein
MAINPLITMGVKPINLDFSDRRLRNAHSDLYEQQADVQRQNIEQEKATMEALKTYGNDITPDTIKQVMQTNPKAAMGMQTVLSKQQADTVAMQKLQMEADKEARLAEGADIENRMKQLKFGTEKAGILADIASPLVDKADLNEEDVHMAIGAALSRGALNRQQAIEFLSKPFNGEATRAELKNLVTTGRSEVERAKIKETALEAARKAVLFPLEVKKAEGEAVNVTRDPVTGRTPGDVVLDQRTAAQRLFDERKAQEQRDFQASENQKNRSVTMRGQNMTDARSRDAAASDDDALVQAVLKDPLAFDNLTPTAKTRIIPALQRNGFDQFGKPLGAGSIDKMAETSSAVASLQDLRQTLKENEQFIGPIAGFAAINPYSDARKAQARIDLVKQRVGKALEGGVLRKEDEEKYKKILATLNDTPETAIAKVDGLISTLERDAKIYQDQQRAAGRRMPAEKKPTGERPPLSSFEGEK